MKSRKIYIFYLEQPSPTKIDHPPIKTPTKTPQKPTHSPSPAKPPSNTPTPSKHHVPAPATPKQIKTPSTPGKR